MSRMRVSLTQGLRRAVQLRADGLGMVSGENRFTWHQILSRVEKLAGLLRGLGLQPGGRVALLAMNSHASYEIYFATIWAGGIVMPLNHRLSAAEMAAQLADAEPGILLLDTDFLAHLPALRAVPSLGHVILIGDRKAPAGVLHYEAALAAATPAPDAGCGGDDGACLFYTGGTTGTPKGVLLSHGNIMANTINFISHIGLDEGTVHLHCGPFFHVAAGVRLFSVTQAAGTHVILPRFAAAEVLEAIEREKVTLATFVPTMVRTLLDQPDLAGYDLSSLQYITYGAAPMAEAMLREAMQALPQVRFVQSYGMTETSPIATLLGWRDHNVSAGANPRLRSAGKAALLADIRIVDPQTAMPVALGEPGEVTVRGPMVMRGYWRQPEATAKAIRDGWMHTGDIGYLDADGYLYVVDRLKDVIISGGENIYSQEVENAIHLHQAVQDCAVFGRPDPKWGETVHAVVVPKPGCLVSAEEIIAHCRCLIASYKCPKTVQVRHTPLPLTGANKVLKVQLRNELLAGLADSMP
jgi:acyl-CoA synthetase (AMP-forming)/AMP-acid ligase II